MSSRERRRRAAGPRNTQRAQTGPRGRATTTPPAAAGLGNRTLLGIIAALVVLVAAWLVIWQFAPGIINAGGNGGGEASSPDGRISFVRMGDDGSRDLYIMDANGKRLERATSGIRVEGTNLWSPDGSSIILQATVNDVQTVVRLDVGPDNKIANSVQLTADVKADSVNPVWSPDGSRIAYQSKGEGGNYQIFVMDAGGNNKRRLSDGKGYAGSPSWSPDGGSVLYVQGDEADALKAKEVYMVPSAGGEPKKLTEGGKALSRPVWSPDGQTIVYAENVADRVTVLHAMNADGTSPRVLVQQGANRGHSFSPVGDHISYYSVGTATGSDIFTVRAAGGATNNLTPNSADDYQPSWSPDGKRLVWSGNREGRYRIIVGDLDGTNQQTITEGNTSDLQPSWGAPVL
jgi:TolB protein